MVQSISNVDFVRVLSIFSIAFLKDTGWYSFVNEEMVENIYFGKNKGCDFVFKGCQNEEKTYEEFDI